jgi:septal ring factor EnvC (AmiA/AmiB activator)
MTGIGLFKVAKFPRLEKLDQIKEDCDMLNHQNMEFQEQNEILGNTLNDQDRDLCKLQKHYSEVSEEREKIIADNEVL